MRWQQTLMVQLFVFLHGGAFGMRSHTSLHVPNVHLSSRPISMQNSLLTQTKLAAIVLVQNLQCCAAWTVQFQQVFCCVSAVMGLCIHMRTSTDGRLAERAFGRPWLLRRSLKQER